MRCFSMMAGIVLISMQACAQSDLMMLINPFPNEERVILNNELSTSETVKDDNQGDDFGIDKHQLSLRVALTLNEDREYYLMLDSLLMDIDSDGRLDGSLESVPNRLNDVGVGLMFRETVHETWKLGGILKVGSASDELFHSSEEWYLRTTLFLQIPHLEYTSWVVIGSIDTNREYPVLPGLGYSFPLSERAFAIVGIPFAGAAGQLTDKTNFQFSFRPLANADARLGYQATKKIEPYVGFKWQSSYFARANRGDSDDRILFEDQRLFAGARVALSEKSTLDLKSGVILMREISEGDDSDERDHNDIDVEDAWFGSLALNIRF